MRRIWGRRLRCGQRLEQHRANASCAVCHDQMDPIGFGLENFDAGGAWREKDGHFAMDSSGKFPAVRRFTGRRSCSRRCKRQPDLFVRNLAEKLLTYALGRGLEAGTGRRWMGSRRKLAADGFRMTDSDRWDRE